MISPKQLHFASTAVFVAAALSLIVSPAQARDTPPAPQVDVRQLLLRVDQLNAAAAVADEAFFHSVAALSEIVEGKEAKQKLEQSRQAILDAKSPKEKESRQLEYQQNMEQKQQQLTSLSEEKRTFTAAQKKALPKLLWNFLWVAAADLDMAATAATLLDEAQRASGSVLITGAAAMLRGGEERATMKRLGAAVRTDIPHFAKQLPSQANSARGFAVGLRKLMKTNNIKVPAAEPKKTDTPVDPNSLFSK